MNFSSVTSHVEAYIEHSDKTLNSFKYKICYFSLQAYTYLEIK